jgi:hypothetical protein
VAALGLSRTVVREAVKMLAAKGLVNTRPRRGTIVPESHWNLADPDALDSLSHRKNVLPLILEFADVRMAIEPAAASLAARVAIRLSNSSKGVALASASDHAGGPRRHRRPFRRVVAVTRPSVALPASGADSRSGPV